MKNILLIPLFILEIIAQQPSSRLIDIGFFDFCLEGTGLRGLFRQRRAGGVGGYFKTPAPFGGFGLDASETGWFYGA